MTLLLQSPSQEIPDDTTCITAEAVELSHELMRRLRQLTKLRSLTLKQCVLPVTWTDLLQDNDVLDELTIESSRGPDHQTSLAALATCGNKLKSIILINVMEAGAATHLATFLKNSACLSKLRIVISSAGDAIVASLAEALDSGHQLKSLCLECVKLSAVGMGRLSETLTKSQVQSLSLDRNPISKLLPRAGFIQLFQALAHTNVQKLSLKDCNIGDESGRCLLEAIRPAVKLLEISTKGNPLHGLAVRDELDRALERHKKRFPSTELARVDLEPCLGRVIVCGAPSSGKSRFMLSLPRVKSIKRRSVLAPKKKWPEGGIGDDFALHGRLASFWFEGGEDATEESRQRARGCTLVELRQHSEFYLLDAALGATTTGYCVFFVLARPSESQAENFAPEVEQIFDAIAGAVQRTQVLRKRVKPLKLRDDMIRPRVCVVVTGKDEWRHPSRLEQRLPRMQEGWAAKYSKWLALEPKAHFINNKDPYEHVEIYNWLVQVMQSQREHLYCNVPSLAANFRSAWLPADNRPSHFRPLLQIASEVKAEIMWDFHINMPEASTDTICDAYLQMCADEGLLALIPKDNDLYNGVVCGMYTLLERLPQLLGTYAPPGDPTSWIINKRDLVKLLSQLMVQNNFPLSQPQLGIDVLISCGIIIPWDLPKEGMPGADMSNYYIPMRAYTEPATAQPELQTWGIKYCCGRQIRYTSILTPAAFAKCQLALLKIQNRAASAAQIIMWRLGIIWFVDKAWHLTLRWTADTTKPAYGGKYVEVLLRAATSDDASTAWDLMEVLVRHLQDNLVQQSILPPAEQLAYIHWNVINNPDCLLDSCRLAAEVDPTTKADVGEDHIFNQSTDDPYGLRRFTNVRLWPQDFLYGAEYKGLALGNTAVAAARWEAATVAEDTLVTPASPAPPPASPWAAGKGLPPSLSRSTSRSMNNGELREPVYFARVPVHTVEDEFRSEHFLLESIRLCFSVHQRSRFPNTISILRGRGPLTKEAALVGLPISDEQLQEKRRLLDKLWSQAVYTSEPDFASGYSSANGLQRSSISSAEDMGGANGSDEPLSPKSPSQPVRIVLAWHGCSSVQTAEAICREGFVHLRKRDAGFFGAGLYLTTDPVYAAYYAANLIDAGSPGGGNAGAKPHKISQTGPHALILCAVVLQHVYPVTRSDYGPDGRCRYRGQTVADGCDAHVVVVSPPDFEAAANPQDHHPLEIVVREDANILPLAVLTLRYDPPRPSGFL